MTTPTDTPPAEQHKIAFFHDKETPAAMAILAALQKSADSTGGAADTLALAQAYSELVGVVDRRHNNLVERSVEKAKLEKVLAAAYAAQPVGKA